jgi:hypothetical protein
MAYLLRTLLLVMLISLILTMGVALNWFQIGFAHIEIAIPSFIFTIFIQAFVMFYFIGVSRLVTNVHSALYSTTNLKELFDTIPDDLTPYKEKVDRYLLQSTVSKRQTIPWTMLMLALGTIGFLLGGAHDTGMVEKTTHSGVIYGFLFAALIGLYKQWNYLGKNHKLLRELKTLFGISNDAM